MPDLVLLNTASSRYSAGRPVVPEGAGGAIAPADFGRSVNPTSTKGDRLCPSNNTDTPGFSDLPTALAGKSAKTPNISIP